MVSKLKKNNQISQILLSFDIDLKAAFRKQLFSSFNQASSLKIMILGMNQTSIFVRIASWWCKWHDWFMQLRNYFWLQKFTQRLTEKAYKQAKKFLQPSKCSFFIWKYLQIKYLKHHAFISMCSFFTWFNLNFCQWNHLEH